MFTYFDERKGVCDMYVRQIVNVRGDCKSPLWACSAAVGPISNRLKVGNLPNVLPECLA